MTQEDKKLLLKDLCARLPYGVIVHFDGWNPEKLTDIDLHTMVVNGMGGLPIPYLRPMSSMTEEERSDMGKAIQKNYINPNGEIKSSGADNLLMCTTRQAEHFIDWLNAHHFDYHGLIEMGLAIEAPEGMYKDE